MEQTYLKEISMNGEIKESDAIQLMQNLPDNHVDLLLTDIPYARVNKPSNGLRIIDKKDANTETFDLITFANEAFRVTKGNAIIFCGKEQFSDLYRNFDDWGATTRMIIWEKTNPMPMNGRYVFLSGVECAVHFRKSKATFNGNCLNTVFQYPNGRSKYHPTEKPLALFTNFINLLTNPGDLVLDPCMGSGTTAIACEQTSRRYICSDINSDYITMAVQRLQGESRNDNS